MSWEARGMARRWPTNHFWLCPPPTVTWRSLLPPAILGKLQRVGHPHAAGERKRRSHQVNSHDDEAR